jgi:hypothetical protein
METVISYSLVIHIASGFTALISGLFAIMAQKGNQKHRIIGKLFYHAMLMVILSASLIAVLTTNAFLLLIALFSLFMNYSGKRSIKNKSLHPNALDWLVLLLGTLNGILMLLSNNLVLLVFGGISSVLAIRELVTFAKVIKDKPLPRKAWLKRHIGMMMGTYIATITAFIVTAGPRFSWYESIQPNWILWLLPTAVLSFLILYFTRKYT